MKVTDLDMEKAVIYLANTDEEYARAKALYNGLDRQTKTIKAMQFMQAHESSATAKEQAAMVSHAYQAHLRKIDQAEIEFLTLHAKRNTSITKIDVWRSLNSARSKGLV